MPTPIFRLVCGPGALDGAPKGWAAEMLEDGEVALLVDAGGLRAVDAVAHALGLLAVRVIRREDTADRQEQTVIDYAGALPLVWLAGEFTDSARTWARDRRPMTLLVDVPGAVSDDERRRIDRFVALLGRQAE
ncbi:MAG: hypothetical protein LC685_00090 [Actinobacteria bacterium]|nr:hypothetical protein [Actinomycetota bacterium]